MPGPGNKASDGNIFMSNSLLFLIKREDIVRAFEKTPTYKEICFQAEIDLLIGKPVNREAVMIVVRDIFQVKFGQAKDAIARWKEGFELGEKHGLDGNHWRLLTDFVGGQYYTLVVEGSFDSLDEFEKKMQSLMSDKEWQNWYKNLIPLIDSGHREVLKAVE
jgi:hypothetical protein